LVGGDVGAATVGRLVVDGVAGELGVSRVDGTTSNPTVGSAEKAGFGDDGAGEFEFLEIKDLIKG
jgi:hypothetical protein